MHLFQLCFLSCISEAQELIYIPSQLVLIWHIMTVFLYAAVYLVRWILQSESCMFSLHFRFIMLF